MAHSLDGDGLLDNFYHHIWLKLYGDKGFRHIVLPDTIIYKYQSPRHWYFTSSDNLIKKKSKKNLSVEEIERVFTRIVSDSGIVATYTYMQEERRIVEFLGLPEFKHFLYHRIKSQDGILQRYIEPKGGRESQIQIVWTPKICLFECRENKKDLFDLRYDTYERLVTFEGSEYNSSSVPMRSESLKMWLKRATQKLVNHIAVVSKIHITRAVLHLKIDIQERIWLLYASSMRVDRWDKAPVPVSLETTIQPPDSVNVKRVSLNPQCPLAIQKSVLCRNCNLAVEPDKVCEISYRLIVARESACRIPGILKRIHDHLELPEFEKLRKDPLFLNKITLVCQNCFLSYSKKKERVYQKGMSTTQPLNPQKLVKRREITLSNKRCVSSSDAKTRGTTATLRPLTGEMTALRRRMIKEQQPSAPNLNHRGFQIQLNQQLSLTNMIRQRHMSYQVL